MRWQFQDYYENIWKILILHVNTNNEHSNVHCVRSILVSGEEWRKRLSVTNAWISKDIIINWNSTIFIFKLEQLASVRLMVQ